MGLVFGVRRRVYTRGLALIPILTAAWFAFPHAASAQTRIDKRLFTVHIPSTTYTTNTTWTLANSPYVIDGNVTIAAGATLTIEPGVIVKFNGQFRTMYVNGTLSAVGTQANPITFTSYQDDSAGGDTNGDGNATSGAPGQWYDITFSSSTSQITYSTLRYGGYGSAQNYAPIDLFGAGYAVTLDHDTITNNQQSAVSIGSGSSATITNSTLSQNSYGVYVNNGSATIDHTTISNNSSRGVYFNLPNFSPLPPATSITSSEITGNAGYGVYIGANGDYPLASMPKGSRNNIYANNSSGVQLTAVGYPAFRRADVNWRNNYWGDVYYWFGNGGCASASPYNSPGHLAYRSATGSVPAGPIDGGTYLYNPSWGANYLCGYDVFKIDSLDFATTKFDTSPRATAGQTLTACTGSADAVDPSSCLQDPVNSATGEFTHVEDDLALPGVGIPFGFSHYYNSLDLTKGDLGQGWTDSYNASLAIAVNGDVTLRAETGQQVQYTKQPDGSFVGGAGTLSTLTSVSGGYDLTRTNQVKYHFNTQGRLLSILDRNGQGVSLAYEGNGRLATVTDASGRAATFTHDANGMLTGISLPDGRSVAYGYTNGQLTSYTDAANKVWTYTYESHGFLEKEIDPLNHTSFRNVYGDDGRVREQYDALNNKTTFSWDQTTQAQTVTDPRNNTWKDVYANNVLTKRIDAAGNTMQFGSDTSLNRTSITAPSGESVSMTYDSRGNRLSITAPPSLGGVSKSFTYDSKNNVTGVTDAKGTQTAYSYDANGNLTQVAVGGTTLEQDAYNTSGELTGSTDARGNSTTYTYDTSGNQTSATDPLGKTTSYTSDAAGNLLTSTDPLGHTSTNTYDASGNELTSADPLGNTTHYAYDAAGNQTSVTDPKGHVTTTAYDAANRVTSVTGPDGGVTSYTYDTAGNKLTQTDPLGHVTSYTYDADNRLTSVTSPLGEKTTFTYDANGNLVSTVDPRGNLTGGNPADYTTSSTYDAAGRVLTTTDQLGHVTRRTYDDVGNLATFRDANDHTTSYTYDGLGQLLTETTPDGSVTAYTYDGNGNVLTRTDANGHVTSYAYDADNRRTSATSPIGRVWSYTYDNAGELASESDPNGVTTTYGHDAGGELASVSYSDSTPSVTYTYDAAGNRLSMTDAAGTKNFSYDAADQLTQVTRGSDTFTYAYNLAGNVTSRTYPDGKVTSYTYDADNRMATATVGGATTSYSYDPASELTQATLPSSNGYAETMVYDRAGRLVDLKNASGGNVLSEFAATLDAVGNPTQIVRSGATSSTSNYTYDANDRLTALSGTNVPSLNWTYDNVGNRLTETRSGVTTNYTYNAADQLTAAGSTNYSYDAAGNQIQAGSRSFTYDSAGELTGTTSGGVTTSYAYDGDGLRTSASVGGAATRYVWDVNHGVPQLALERDGSNNELRAYGYGLQRISMTTPDGAFYYHYDILGSVANLTSSTGTTEWTESYEPFGNTLTETQNDPSAPANPMKFAGEYQDATGLYNLRARGYDPAQGRFTSLDPERDTGDAPSSAYAYADDRPTVADDPTGLHTEYLNPFAVGSDDASGIVNPKRKAPRYVSPFKRMDSKNLVPGRVDQGVDYHGYGVIRAIGDAFIIHGTYDPAWYGYYIVYRLKNGPFKGKCIYVAEGIKPTRAEKTPVDAGDTIAQFGPNAAPGRSPGIETGWSAESGKAETTRAYERRKGNVPSDHNNLPEGQAFARFLHWLHVPLTTDPRYRVPNLNRGAKYI